MKIHQPIAGLCLAMLLTACGGGSSGGETAAGSASPNLLVSTGIFVDSPVNGLNYTTGTQYGKTNAKGEFSYVAGENITFSIGSIQFPTVLANATITPLDIAKTTDINHQVVSNILILLQSLDEDGNPSNGISISAAAATAATVGVNFDVSPSAFSANAAVTKLLANSGSVNKTLVSEATAKAHFQNTLNGTTGTTKINVAPVANSGTAQSLLTGSVVTLDASASSDANKDTLTYLWILTSKPSGSAAVLSALVSAKPTFMADVAGAYVAKLVVNDGKLDSTASTVTVTVSAANAAPVANAGAAQSVLVKSTVALNGAASSDANGDTLTYTWTLTSKPEGSTTALANTTSVNPTFVPDMAGAYVVSLVVNDGKLNSAASTVAVTSAVANVAPVANAGINQNVKNGAFPIPLDGSSSSDANGDTLTYQWTFVSIPVDSSPQPFLYGRDTVRPHIFANVPGTYVISLVVSDGKVSSAPSTVTITATAVNINSRPNAGVGFNQNVAAGSVVTLNGSTSSDANGNPLTYSWTLTSKPAGSVAALSSLTAVKPTFMADLTGTYVAGLTVNDGMLNSEITTTTVTAAADTLTLSQPADSFFGGPDTVLSMPYATSSSVSANVNCVGSNCANVYDVATYKLSVATVGQSYTISNLQAINLTNGSAITPLFNGLVNGQIIANGTTATFKLQSPFTLGTTVNLKYSFTVLETGNSFSYTVQLRTN